MSEHEKTPESLENLPTHSEQTDPQLQQWVEMKRAALHQKPKHYPIRFRSRQEDPNDNQIDPYCHLENRHWHVQKTDLETDILRALHNTGQTNIEAANLLIKQLAKIQTAEALPDAINGSLALLAGLKPADTMEGILCTQMLSTHKVAMDFFMESQSYGSHIAGRDERSMIHQGMQLMGLFTRQMEVLQQYRHRNQQNITVRNVQVTQGGQAIIGDIRPTEGEWK